ncbi:hypothetical protein [Micromonospora sp. NPDC093277]|uniref:hypothetical protein n=1 Tax=Micromonospora sp. NPDC093277 TaxID=3364291 RepID=UPI0038159BFD
MPNSRPPARPLSNRVGTATGGLVAQATGSILAPFWLAAGALTVLTALAWRRLADTAG